MTEIQRADPDARKTAVWITLIGASIGLLLLVAYSLTESHIFRWIESNTDYLAQSPYIGFLFGLVLVIPVLIGAGYLLVYGQRAVKARRLPPPGYAVVRDTKVQVGPTAIRRGRIVQTLALVLILAALVTPIFLWYALALLSSDA